MPPGSPSPAAGEAVKPVTACAPRSLYASRHPALPIEGFPMLLLTAILRIWSPREIEPNDLLAQTRLKVGYVGLTVIALVYVLVSFWQAA